MNGEIEPFVGRGEGDPAFERGSDVETKPPLVGPRRIHLRHQLDFPLPATEQRCYDCNRSITEELLEWLHDM